MEERLRRLKELLKNPFQVEEFLRELQEFEKEIQTLDPQTLRKISKEYQEVKEVFLRNYETLRGLWEVKRYVRA